MAAGKITVHGSQTEVQPKRITLEAVRYRACGEEHRRAFDPTCPDCTIIEDRGVVAYHHRNPIRQLIWRVFKKAT